MRKACMEGWKGGRVNVGAWKDGRVNVGARHAAPKSSIPPPFHPSTLYFIITLLVLAWPAAGRAWWEKGHQIIAANAAAALPDDMPAFFKAGAPALIRLSTQPDAWKGYGAELRRMETPEHYFDTEKMTDDPMKIGLYPDRYGALKAIFDMNETPAGVGLLPYRLVEEYQRLRGTFAQHRRDPANESIQQEILVYAGLLGHYAGDTAQPLHLTIHFDGRVDRNGNVTSGRGIHERFEGHFVTKFIEQTDCRPYVRAPEAFDNVYQAIREAFAASFAAVNEVYRLDETGRLTAPDEAAKTFVRQRLAHGSSFLASLWYTAWKDSETVK